MIVSISQPAYLPWLGYFDRIAKSDVAIVLDNVMLERSSKTRFTNRNKIRSNDSWSWLTIPVKTADLGQPLIMDVELDDDQRWATKHFGSICHHYARAPFFKDYKEWFQGFYAEPWTRLNPLLTTSTDYLLKELSIKTPLLFSSQLAVGGEKSDLILNLCKHVGATVYLSGPFGREYLDIPKFTEAGIDVNFHDYAHPTYTQIQGGFVPYMSIVDLLFNYGVDSLNVLVNADRASTSNEVLDT